MSMLALRDIVVMDEALKGRAVRALKMVKRNV
jgi:hypothetical protein